MKRKKMLKGFSLGEVLLSITVLTVGILPMLGALVGALNTSLDSQETVIASGLAQEGAELVLNMRDNTILGGHDAFDAFYKWAGVVWARNPWCRISLADSNGVNGALDDPSSVHQIGCQPFFSGSAPANYFDLTLDANGVYKHMDAPGKFKRRIYLEPLPGPFIPNHSGIEGYDVVSAVYWGTYGDTATNVNTKADLLTNCTAAKGCVYTRVKLAPWK